MSSALPSLLGTACEGVKALEAFQPRWLEEPVAWHDDRRLLKMIARRTRIPLSGGESEHTSYGCRALLEDRAVAPAQRRETWKDLFIR